MTHIGREVPRLKDANVGGALTSTNPAEQRRLNVVLEQLDREKEKCLGTLEWNQRNFFIKQVFDHNNDLRFVKASERPKYLPEVDLPDGKVEDTTDASREHLEQGGVDPPPSSPNSDDAETDDDESDGISLRLEELDKQRNKPPHEDDKARVTSSVSEQSQWKLPILKVRAMGLFANPSSTESPPTAGKKSSEVTHLPPTPETSPRKRNLSGNHHGNNTMTSKLLPGDHCDTPLSPTNNRGGSFVTQALLSPLITRRHISARRSLDVNDLRMLKGHRSREDFLSSPSTIRRQRSRSRPAMSSRGNYFDQCNQLFEGRRNGSVSYGGRFGHMTKSSESIERLSDGECDEKVIRKLVRSLPTQLLLRARERETETGSRSAGVEEMKRKLLERCRSETNQRTVEDPRFQKLANSLTEVDRNISVNYDQILD